MQPELFTRTFEKKKQRSNLLILHQRLAYIPHIGNGYISPVRDHDINFSRGEEIGIHLYFETGYFGGFIIIKLFDAHVVHFDFEFGE